MDNEERNFAEVLNYIYGTVWILGMPYDYGTALFTLDPIAFRCAMNDYEDTIEGDNGMIEDEDED